MGSPVYSAEGHVRFDGVDDYLDLGWVNVVKPFSVAAWIKPDEYSGSWQRIFEFFNSPDGVDSIYLTRKDTSTQCRFGVDGYGSNGGDTYADSPHGCWSFQTWFHIAMTVDDSGIILYKNGKKFAEKAYSTTNPIPPIMRRGYIGKSSYANVALFKGSMADIKLLDVAVTAAGMAHMYSSDYAIVPPPIPPASANISLAGGVPGAVVGSSTSGNVVAQPMGSPVYTAEGHMRFDGVDDYLDLGWINVVKPFSVAAWVKPDEHSGSWQRVLEFFNDADGYDAIRLTRKDTSTQCRFGVNGYGSNGGHIYADSPDGCWSFRTWFHIAMTVDDSGFILYKNGKKIAEKVYATTDPILPSMRHGYIGKSIHSRDALFKGSMADIKLLDVAVPAAGMEHMYFSDGAIIPPSPPPPSPPPPSPPPPSFEVPSDLTVPATNEQISNLSIESGIKYAQITTVTGTLLLWGYCTSSGSSPDSTGCAEEAASWGGGFSDLVTVGGLSFNYCDRLTHVRLFPKLKTVTGKLELQSQQLGALRSLDGFGNITSVGSILIDYGPDLLTLDGLHNVKTCDGSFVIHGQRSLTDAVALSSLTTINGNVVLTSLSSLTSLSIFRGDLAIAGTITISDNAQLCQLLVDDFCAKVGLCTVSHPVLLLAVHTCDAKEIMLT
jgi:hypothetical protein